MWWNRFRWIGTCTVLGISTAAILWNIAVEPLDHGYPRYTAIADAMVRTGDWIVPRLDGRIYVQKPPLFIWLVAIPIAIAGRVPEWAGHLPNIIACAGILFGAYLFSRRIFADRQKALLSVLILATSYEFSFQVREERLDMVFIAFLLGAFLCFYQAVTATSPALGRTARIIACYLFVALATLTKGPVGLLFFLAVVIPFVLWTGKGRFLLERECLIGYGIFLLISSIWPLLVIARVGLKEALSVFQATEMITRREGPFFYFVELPIIFSPWIIFLPAVVIWLVREKPYRGSEGIRFLLCWFGAFFALLHLSSGKSTRYLLPAMLPLAMLTAGAVYGTMTAAAQLPLRWIRRLRDGTVWLLLATILGASFASPLLFSIAPEDKLFVIAGGLMAGIGGLIAIRQFFKYHDPIRCLFFIGMLILFLYAIFDTVNAQRFIRNDTRVLAEQALEPITAGAPARTYGLKNTQRQFLVSMLTRRSVPFVSTLPELKEWVRKEAGGEVFVVADSKHVNELLMDPALSAESYATFCLEKHDIKVLRVAAGKRPVGTRYE